jgi:hypothetical protein
MNITYGFIGKSKYPNVCEVVNDTFGIMLGLSMLFNATFNNIVFIYRGDQLYWWSKQDYTKKTTDLPQIPNKLYRIVLNVSFTTSQSRLVFEIKRHRHIFIQCKSFLL